MKFVTLAKAWTRYSTCQNLRSSRRANGRRNNLSNTKVAPSFPSKFYDSPYRDECIRIGSSKNRPIGGPILQLLWPEMLASWRDYFSARTIVAKMETGLAIILFQLEREIEWLIHFPLSRSWSVKLDWKTC